MSDLHALLDRAAGHPPDLPDLDLIRRRGDALRTRRRLRWALGAGTAALLLGAVATGSGPGVERGLVPAGERTATSAVGNACPRSSTASGDIAYTRAGSGADGAVFVTATGGGPGRCLVDTAGPDASPAWSPDGRWIAFVGGDGTRADLFLVRADGSTLIRLTDTDRTEVGPVWSPDGTRIGYTLEATARDPSAVHVVGRDGRSDEVVLMGPRTGMVQLEDWSPDGATLVFGRDDTAEGGHIALWAMSPDGSDARRLRVEEGDVGSGARWSPDGTWLAFHADLDGGCVYRSDALVRELTRVTAGCAGVGSLSWSPDGSRLALAGGAHGPDDLVVVEVDGSGREVLIADGTASGVDWRAVPTE